MGRPGFRQFIKFCIVGASSTVIDFGVYLWLMEIVHLPHLVQPLWLARMLAQTASFSLAVTNGFYWNNRWTFSHVSREGSRARFAKFVLTNIIGLALNLGILTVVAHLVGGPVVELLTRVAHLKDPQGLIGKMVATAVVLSWNFTASRLWTFKS